MIILFSQLHLFGVQACEGVDKVVNYRNNYNETFFIVRSEVLLKPRLIDSPCTVIGTQLTSNQAVLQWSSLDMPKALLMPCDRGWSSDRCSGISTGGLRVRILPRGANLSIWRPSFGHDPFPEIDVQFCSKTGVVENQKECVHYSVDFDCL